ncbi:MAG: hypothetical protein ACI4CT_04660 [Lachnospiraceae bacterium]
MVNKDLMYLQSLYPEEAKTVLKIVQQECDKVDYEGSHMYDEYPDKEWIRFVSRQIQEKISDVIQDSETTQDEWEEEALSGMDAERRMPPPPPGCGPGRPCSPSRPEYDRPEHHRPEHHRPEHHRPCGPGRWCPNSLVDVLLLNEILCRRSGRC